MNKSDVIDFFDKFAPHWDADQIPKDAIINRILDNSGIGEGLEILDVACGTGVLFPFYLERKVRNVTGIDISHEMARLAGDDTYLVARKGTKVYMPDPISVEVRSITTQRVQHLYLDGKDAEKMRGKRVLIVDDVISTGESLRAIEALVEKAGGIICGRMAILAEGDAQTRPDLTYLEKLPLFNADGTVKG